MQYITTQYHKMQHNTMHYNTLQCIKMHYNTLQLQLQYIAMNYKTLHCNALQSIHYNTLQCIKMHYNTLQIHYKTLQYITIHHNTIQHNKTLPFKKFDVPKISWRCHVFGPRAIIFSMSCERQSVDTLGRTGDVYLRHPFQTLLVHRGDVVWWYLK